MMDTDLKKQIDIVYVEIQKETRIAASLFHTTRDYQRMGWMGFIMNETGLNHLYTEADEIIGRQRARDRRKQNRSIIFKFT